CVDEDVRPVPKVALERHFSVTSQSAVRHRHNGWMGPAHLRVDLNADLAEGVTDDEGVLGLVTSANVACGFHAGDEATMRAVCATAVRRGVVVGAQVSYDDREGFGRRRMDVAYDLLRGQVAEQVATLGRIAEEAGTPLCPPTPRAVHSTA